MVFHRERYIYIYKLIIKDDCFENGNFLCAVLLQFVQICRQSLII